MIMELDLFGNAIYEDEIERNEFIDNEYNDEYDDEYNDDYSYNCGGYQWTEEDSWDALTDGMYGDMPGSPMEYDAMMDAMGY